MEIMGDVILLSFNAMVAHSDFEDALKLINGISNEIPPPSMVNDIIFKILWVDCTEKVANKANVFLCSCLSLLQRAKSKSKDFRYDYRETLQDKSGKFTDIWSVFSHILKSCFSLRNASEQKKSYLSEYVKYPNCNIIADFYVGMITRFLSVENTLFEDDAEERFSMLLVWINKIYKLNDHWIPIRDNLHTILDKKVNAEICDESKIEAMVNTFLDELPNIFNTAENMKTFFAAAKLSHLQLKICQHMVYELIHKKKFPKKKHATLTLKTLIYNYFFEISAKNHKGKKLENLQLNETPANNSRHLLEIFFLENMEGDTALHELCRKNQPGDLLDVILNDSKLEPKARNSAGYTPLHVACLAGSYHCAQFLLKEVKFEDVKIELRATDNNGMTPLHCAAYAGSLDVVKLLLKHGGTQLKRLEDNFGRKAEHYAKSETLKKELRDAESGIEESMNSEFSTATSDQWLTDLNTSNLTVPKMNNQEEYSIFLFGLFYILSTYLDTSGLLKSKKEPFVKLSHSKYKCPHYASTAGAVICDEDASIFTNLSQVLSHFIACIQIDAKKINVGLRLNLLPYLCLKAVLDDV